jgi:adenosyl cobinamide kinase/adenosyl cobinamide phosphate guanylyltransferase
MSEGELVLLLGGARAGKSAFALRLARERATATSVRVCFIATAETLDEEMEARIARHRAERPRDWLTIEEPKRLDIALGEACNAEIVIVDCLTLLVSNWLLTTGADCEQEMMRVLESFLALVRSSKQTIICVSNEVGLGLVPEAPLGRAFRDILGRVNQRFAESATEVYLLVAGLPLQLKAKRVRNTEEG